jgi:hypothetical protein
VFCKSSDDHLKLRTVIHKKGPPKDHDHGTTTDVFINFWISQVFLVSFNKNGLETIMGVMTIYEIWGDCPNFSFQSFSKILNNLKGTS